MSASQMQWFVVPVLLALARHLKSTSGSINAAQLSAWVSSDALDFTPGLAEAALMRLHKQGLVSAHSHGNKQPAVRQWRLTPRGLLAARAAVQAQPGEVPDVRALATRLWNLLRIRRHLTALEAAQTLADAEGDFTAEARRIAALLAAWARHAPRTVTVARKREGGRIRYVLLKDVGRWPPASRVGQPHPSDFADMPAVPERYRIAQAPEGAAQ